VGNRLWKENVVSGNLGTPVHLDELYAYDGVNQLTSARRGNLNANHDGIVSGTESFAQNWTLDATGNFAEFKQGSSQGTWTLDQDRVANAANEIDVDNNHANTAGDSITGTGANWADPTYDAAGNMIFAPKTGSETTGLHYVYDAWNRQVKVYADASGSLSDLMATYKYDGAKRRIEKVVTAAGGGAADLHYYYNANWQLLEERSMSGSTLLAANQYVWSPRYIDAPLVRFHDGNADGDCDPTTDVDDTIRYYTSDANHNVTTTITIGYGSPSTTTTTQHIVYDAYGKATVYNDTWSTNLGAPAEDGPLYCGYFFDAETANYIARHRIYSVVLATWLSRDPIGYNGGVNLYEYVGNEPLTRTDPSGKISITINTITMNVSVACVSGRGVTVGSASFGMTCVGPALTCTGAAMTAIAKACGKTACWSPLTGFGRCNILIAANTAACMVALGAGVGCACQ
jgi:RHS repeat-associated protein